MIGRERGSYEEDVSTAGVASRLSTLAAYGLSSVGMLAVEIYAAMVMKSDYYGPCIRKL